jgi:PAS domain S-box-containing protein
MTVQGYWAIAYHVPCFDKDGIFRGSLAFLVPFRDMFRRLFTQLLPGDDTIPLVLSDDGLILFSTIEEYEGRHYSEVFTVDSGEMKVADAVLYGNSGYMLTDFMTFVEDADQPESMLSTVVPFDIQGISWILILSAPEATVMRHISGMSNRWLGGMIAIILLALIYSTLKVRVWITSKEEEKWEDIAHLKDVLIRTVNQTKEIIVILDSKERIIYANRAAVNISGFGKVLLNSKIANVPFQELDTDIRSIRRLVMQNEAWSGRITGTGTKNHFFKLDMTVSSIIDEDGTISNFIIIARDVTIQAAMERKLHEQQKMEAIGQLAGGIAHDFNNLLVGILGHAELLKEHYSEDGKVSKAANVIISAVHQGSELTRQLLGFARKGKHQIARVDIGQCVRDINDLLTRTLDQRIRIILDLEEGIYVKGDSTQIEQVILNLAVNARDAMPKGGELCFTLKRETVPAEIIGGEPEDRPIELAVLKTADSGNGISEEHLEKIFEPFFTTKDEEGTGMGLATVYGIVVNHGGWVDVDSHLGEGTVFTVYLPIDKNDEKQESEKYELENRISQERDSTVLIVDDEYIVVATLTELLTEIGYRVSSVPSGKRAVEVYNEDPDAFDVVILDLSMPGMDGRECFMRLHDINPAVKVVLATGFSRNGRVQELLNMGVKGFLQKPFRLKELAAMLEYIVDV